MKKIKKKVKSKTKISYLGPPGTFSYLAVRKKFPGQEYLPVKTIPKAIIKVCRKETSLAVVPLKNSIGGEITETVAILKKNKNLVVADQFSFPIHLSLMTQKTVPNLQEKKKKDKIKLENLEFLASKDNVFGQCSKWIKKNLPRIECVQTSSTAAAAKLATAKPKTGAIGPRSLAKKHDLQVLADKIENQKNNRTTFIVLKSK